MKRVHLNQMLRAQAHKAAASPSTGPSVTESMIALMICGRIRPDHFQAYLERAAETGVLTAAYVRAAASTAERVGRLFARNPGLFR